MHLILHKLKEVACSVVPIVLFVLCIHFFTVEIPSTLLIRFLIGAAFIILGLTVFLLGVDIGVVPLGNMTGKLLARSNKLIIVLLSGVLLGFFISIAEPGLMVLSNQIAIVSNGALPSMLILIVVSIGLAILLAVGFIRIFYRLSLSKILIVLYGIIVCLSFFSSSHMLAIAFDASGSTTGILAVPFILSLATGISQLRKDSKSSEMDSFGLVAIASTGAILSVLIMGIVSPFTYESQMMQLTSIDMEFVLLPFINELSNSVSDSLLAILPLSVIFLILQKFFFRLKHRQVRKYLTGFIYAVLGLFLFLMGVNAGFMDVGLYFGQQLVTLDNQWIILWIAFVLGVLTILAEPSVHVLTAQIEEVTSGSIRRVIILIALALGVGIAIVFAILRILIEPLQLWHFLLPGYIMCLLLMKFTPKLFVGIAFDAGGVATGPMTATFIFAFVQGAAQAYGNADMLVDGFGMIALVAMMPIITIELLGVLYKGKGDVK